MTESFNAYREWLDLEESEACTDYYCLLGLEPFESDQDRIVRRADQLRNKIRAIRPGDQIDAWQSLLDHFAAAKSCLIDAAKKKHYDQQLRQGASQPYAKTSRESPSNSSGSGPSRTQQIVAGKNPAPPGAVSPEVVSPEVVASELVASETSETTNQPAPMAIPVAPVAAAVDSPTEPSDPTNGSQGSVGLSTLVEKPVKTSMARKSKSQDSALLRIATGLGIICLIVLVTWAGLKYSEQEPIVGDTAPKGDRDADTSRGGEVINPPPIGPTGFGSPVQPIPRLTRPEGDNPSGDNLPGDNPSGEASEDPADEKAADESKPDPRLEDDKSKPTVADPKDKTDKPKMAEIPDEDESERPASAEDVKRMMSYLAEAKRLMGKRELDAAAKKLLVASSIAKSKQQKALVEKMQVAHSYVNEFWKALRESLKTLGDVAELKINTTRISVVEADEDHLIIRAGGRTLRYDRLSIPAGLARAIVDRYLDPNDPLNKVIVGAFYWVDPNGDDEGARKLWDEASLSGVDVEDMLSLLNEQFDGSSPDALKVDASQGPLPNLALRSESIRRIRVKYATRYKEAKSRQQRYDLAKFLLEEAGKPVDNSAIRFAMFSEARMIASRSALAILCMTVVDEMEKWFEIDSLKLKTKTLLDAAKASNRTTASEVVLELLNLVDDAIDEDDLKLADRLAHTANNIARSKARNLKLAKRAIDRVKEIQALVKGAKKGKTSKKKEAAFGS